MQRRLFILFSAVLALCGCDDIAFEDRFVEAGSVVVAKNVLIEDFTGQNCLNCPLATKEIDHIRKANGKEHVIAVAIHGGSMAMFEDKSPVGLANATGNAYHNYWNVKSWPAGIVDRKGGVVDYPQWTSLTRARLEMQPGADIVIDATHDAADGIVISTTLTAKTDADAKLQLWLTENDVTAVQRMPDGEYNSDYVHNHVFRATVNGQWGEDVTLSNGTALTFRHTIAVQPKWNAQNLAIVAFVWNETDGVLQVVEKAVSF